MCCAALMDEQGLHQGIQRAAVNTVMDAPHVTVQV